MKFKAFIFPKSRSILLHSDLLDYDHKCEDNFNPKAFWKWSRHTSKNYLHNQWRGNSAWKIQKIPSKWPKDPLAKFFTLFIQFSILVFHEWSFFFFIYFLASTCIFWISTWCHLNRVTFTSKSLIALSHSINSFTISISK